MATRTLNTDSLSIRAYAGCGKSTTLVWTETKVPKGIKPSPQQEAIFERLRLTPTQRRKVQNRFCCFNVSIKNELQDKMPEAECVTNNGLGHRTLGAFLKRRVFVNDRKYDNIIKEVIGDPWKNKKLWKPFTSLKTLVDKARVTLTGDCTDSHYECSIEDLQAMASMYSIDIEDWTIADKVEQVINDGAHIARTKGVIDFTDQVFLPAYYNAKPEKRFRTYVDEAQDLNAAQRFLLLNSAEQIVIVGDPNQAIYLFTGASPDSMFIMESELNAPTLPLSVTRRCPKSHVAYAKRFLPQDNIFEAHEDAIEGTIKTVDINLDLYRHIVKNGIDNLFLSRTNAPLVQQCFSCYRNNIPAQIRGRDMGKQIKGKLNKFIDKTSEEAIAELTLQIDTKINKYTAAGKDDMVEALHDELAVYLIFLTETASVREAVKMIDDMFAEEQMKHAINLSSVHRAKGLEAHTVGIITPDLLPHPGISRISPQWQDSERCIAYVAYTRSYNTLLINAEKTKK